MKLKQLLIIVLTMFLTYSYSQEMVFEWNKIIGNTGHTTGLSIDSDTLGYIYASGSFEDSINYNGNTFNSHVGKDGYLFKLDSLGNLIWSKQYSSNYDVKINSVTVDKNNNVIVLGDYKARVYFDLMFITNNKDTVYSSNMFIAKYAPNGNLLWAKNTGGISYEGNSIAVDMNNDILITGKSVNITYFDTLTSVKTLDSTYYSFPWPHWIYYQPTMGFITKYDQNGNKIWIRHTDGNPQEIIADNNNNIVVTGNFNNNINSFDGTTVSPIGTETSYLAKYNTNNTLIWVKLSGGSANWNCGYGLEIDSANNIYQSGQLLGNSVKFDGSIVSPFEGTNAFLSKYDPLGNLSWYRIIGTYRPINSTGSNFNRGSALKLDKNGDVLLLGFFLDTLTFGTTSLMSNGAYDLLFLKYNSSGTVLSAAQYSDYGWVDGYDLTIDNNNDIYITGLTSLTIGNSSYPFYGFIGKLDESVPLLTVNVQETTEQSNILIYPNPANGIINIKFADSKHQKKIEIYSFDGKKVNDFSFTESNISFEVEGSGLYLIVINLDGKTISKKIVVN